MISIAYQGEPGAWSEQAAFDAYGPDAAPQPFATFDQVFDAVAGGVCARGCVPLENSLGGSIHRNYDLLMRHNLRVIGEMIVRVRWCLITHPGVTQAEIKRVQSHWQALAQTEQTLERLFPHATRAEVYDTAGSVKLLKAEGARDTAAIASRRAAEIYQMPVLLEGLEDDPTNYTRFVMLAREADANIGRSADRDYKTSIVFAMRNIPGSLFRSLAAFALRDIDLCKIESRPLQGSPWEYLFTIDIIGHSEDEPVRRALDHLREIATILRVLGSYPRADMPK
jgi:prephenate dehydratase